jgi:hypothetical protein
MITLKLIIIYPAIWATLTGQLWEYKETKYQTMAECKAAEEAIHAGPHLPEHEYFTYCKVTE